jgi:hypothetical protein
MSQLKMVQTVLLLGALAGCARGAEGKPDLKIRGGAFANWWNLAETVNFKRESGELPKGTAKLRGRVLNSAGTAVADTRLDIATFLASGWSWKPERPGFYSVTFSLLDATGGETPVTESLKCGARRFDYDRHQVAVLPSPTRPPAACPAILGASVGWDQTGREQAETEVRLGTLVGLHFMRVQPVWWAKIEPREGVYDWSACDWWMEAAHRMGFSIVANPWGTPKWAASNSSTATLFLFPDYMKSMPAKTEYWTRFLKAAMARYPYIHDWQLWNEAGLPDQSCFWNGTPDAFFELMKTGYETVKAVRPGDTVWNGCPLPSLYDLFLTRGGAAYFDKLDLHGKWIGTRYAGADGHKTIGQTHGIAKPWGTLEWHAILNSASDPRPTEESLARNMLLDFMDMVRMGADPIAIHALRNGQEMEMLDYFRDTGNGWNHAAGLFRTLPRTEPRLAAVVLRNFMDNFSGTIRYQDGFVFGDGLQCAARLSSASGEVIVFWQNGKEPGKMDPALAKALRPASLLLDWEGRTHPEGAALMLLPDHVYLIRNPAAAAATGWTTAQVLKESFAEPVLDNTVNGLYRPGRLFDGGLNVIKPETLRWHELATYVSLCDRTPGAYLPPTQKLPRPAGLAAKFAVACDENGLDLLVAVTDSTHVQNAEGDRQWEGDGVQLALDTVGKGVERERVEFAACLGPKGPVLWKQKAAFSNGLILAQCTQENNHVKNASLKIERTPGGLLYKIHLDAGELYPLKGSGKIRCALLVNNNDGAGREGWLEWASGIGQFKDPQAYGNLTPDLGSAPLLTQKELRGQWGEAVVAVTPTLTRLNSTAAPQGVAALSTENLRLVAGGRYRITFQARGNLLLHGMLLFKADPQAKGKRFDFTQGADNTDYLRLTAEWKPFSAAFIAPEQATCSALSLFAWHQDGFFEIRDFLLAPATN